MPGLSNEMKTELKSIINRLYILNYFDEKRYVWLTEQVDETITTHTDSLYIYMLKLIMERPTDYDDDYLKDINEFVSFYPNSDIQHFKDEIYRMANYIDEVQFNWLIENIENIPYKKDYISAFGNKDMLDPKKQGMDRIVTYIKYNEEWITEKNIIYDV